MLGSKIGARNLFWARTSQGSSYRICPLVHMPAVIMAGIFLLSSGGCVMTKAQGERLSNQVRELEDEVAKLQRVRHDMEVLLVGQVRDIIDRIAQVESQLSTLRETLFEGSHRSDEMIAEIQDLRNELEQAHHRYRNLKDDQQELLKSQRALKEAQEKIRIPPLREDHFAVAKKYYLGGRFDEANYLFVKFVEEYPKESEFLAQSYYFLGEISRKLGDGDGSRERSEKLYKQSVIYYQKIVDMYKNSILSEEALFKMGLVLKGMGHEKGARAAFRELLKKNSESKRAAEANSYLSELEKGSKAAK